MNIQEYIINNNFLNNYANSNNLNLKEKKSNNFVKTIKNDNLEDSIFWCFYKIINGEFNYNLNKGFKEQVNTKILFIEELRKKKSELKQNKIKLTTLESDLMNDKDLNINSLHALCVIFNKNIVYTYKNLFFSMIQNDDDEIYLISNKEKGYEFKQNISKEKVDYFKNNYYELLNISKPIKAINNYSKEELFIYAKKLNIDINDKISKQDLYQKIKIECMKFK